jgi:hypothetical protein
MTIAVVIGDVTAYAFDKSSQLLADRTKDLELLHDKLASLHWGKKTGLLDAVSPAIRALPHEPQDEYRRIAIIISNGEDDCSRTKEKTVMRIAQQNGVVVYALDTYFSFRRHSGSRLMERLAHATGGRLLFPEDVDHVEQSFVQLRNDLSAQYWVTLAIRRQVEIQIPPTRCRASLSALITEVAASTDGEFLRSCSSAECCHPHEAGV